VTPTRKTSPRTKPTKAESEPAVEVTPEPESERVADVVDDARVAPATSVSSTDGAAVTGQDGPAPSSTSQGTTPGPKKVRRGRTSEGDTQTAAREAQTAVIAGFADSEQAGTERAGTAQADTAQAGTAQADAEQADTAQAAATTARTPAPVAPAPLNATQLQNDPLLGTHDEIIVDLGRKLRWAAVGYALLGVVASWLIAAEVGIATKSGAPFGWALAATILILAGALWYFADVSTRFTSVAAYRKAKTPQAIARLDRGAVVGLYATIGAWIGAALGALVVVSGTVTAVLTLGFGAAGWAWFFGAVPVVLLYLYCFGLLHYRLLEKTRDAVA
jgi:hypothetical protein